MTPKTLRISFVLLVSLAVIGGAFGNAARTARITTILDGITAPGEGSLFATLRVPLFPVTDPLLENYQVITLGNISSSNSLRVGSISKMFTGFIALAHARLNLFSTVSSYGISPANYPGSDTVQMRRVMSHESGIPEYANEKLINFTADPIDWKFGGEFTPAKNVEVGWAGQPLDFVPGSKYCYSNTNFEVVGVATKAKTGKSTQQFLNTEFTSSFNSLKFDDGSLPAGGWPDAIGYQDWPYPASMPSVSGSLTGTAYDVMRGFRKISRSGIVFNIVMQTWHNNMTPCEGSGATNVAGSAYGFALQRYDGLTGSPLVGHDATLIARSILLYNQKTRTIFFFHYTNDMSNAEILVVIDKLMKAN